MYITNKLLILQHWTTWYLVTYQRYFTAVCFTHLSKSDPQSWKSVSKHSVFIKTQICEPRKKNLMKEQAKCSWSKPEDYWKVCFSSYELILRCSLSLLSHSYSKWVDWKSAVALKFHRYIITKTQHQALAENTAQGQTVREENEELVWM